LRASGETFQRRDPAAVETLTPQEFQVARFVAAGGTNRDVAAQLFLSHRTVAYHLHNVYRKLGVTSRTELARVEFERGLEMSPAEECGCLDRQPREHRRTARSRASSRGGCTRGRPPRSRSRCLVPLSVCRPVLPS
jgi:DNA-binding CsgD family transcriptional regulator